MVPNAVVLVADRLGSGFLGPYGNTWFETAAWNRLAARATLFETAIVDSPDLLRLYNSYWRGQHALADRAEDVPPLLVDMLADRQVQSWLITDERLVAERAEAHAFTQRVVLPPGGPEEASSIEQTQLGRIFATLLDVLSQAQPPFLIWLHAQAMEGPWDAPYSLRMRQSEEGDPDPPTFLDPPDLFLERDYDPDVLLGIQQAYGAQVTVLDACLDILLDALWSSSLSDSTALLATGARGFPLGEHRYVGRAELPLWGELLQVPWLTAWPDAQGAAWRVQQTVQPPDLYTTLGNWFGVRQATGVWGRNLCHEHFSESATPDQLIACSQQEQQRAIRVPGWFLRRDGEETVELYVKPDDRWEFNEISSRCLPVVDELTRTLVQFEQAARRADRSLVPELSELLNHESS